jgi:hypothetical protein
MCYGSKEPEKAAPDPNFPDVGIRTDFYSSESIMDSWGNFKSLCPSLKKEIISFQT